MSYLSALHQTDRYLICIALIIKSSMSLSLGRRWIKAFTSYAREDLMGPGISFHNPKSEHRSRLK